MHSLHTGLLFLSGDFISEFSEMYGQYDGNHLFHPVEETTNLIMTRRTKGLILTV